MTLDLPPELVHICYLLAGVLFIFGLKGLTHPRTAVRGNVLGSSGMLLAVVITLLSMQLVHPWIIVAGLVVGGSVGTLLAVNIEMTAMPQLVGLFNGFGGGASGLVAGAALLTELQKAGDPSILSTQMVSATAVSGLVGAVTFWGSLIAFGKLQGLVSEAVMRYPGDQVVKVLLLVVALGCSVYLVMEPGQSWTYWALTGSASILGILLVIPIGGADMPVVISLLNSYSGLAAAATGFVLSNSGLIIAGTLVGASGLILTMIMCDAMNRSLANVLFGGFGGQTEEDEEIDEMYEGNITSTSPEEVEMMLDSARRVVFAPGYGMAVAQAQHAVAELMELLEANGVEVEFAIHPVAGRMPGHMNVLLAEAEVPYDKLKDLESINPTFSRTDLVIVIGANDVVNPLANTDDSSPISGMPVLNVGKARTVVVIKRSLSPGFSGIPNPLFAADNTMMLFGDGKEMILDCIQAYKETHATRGAGQSAA